MRVTCVGNVARMTENYGGETLGKESRFRPRFKWEYIIKLDPKGIGCVGVD
jgi:hypothetical protein